ncbi:50S ribosomal protein L1 [Patescibacteria group bacterium]|nr:50S ribosomal protein L1 [Patescibacteria group bacterium]
MSRSKHYNELKKQVEKDKLYPIDEALGLLQKTSKTKFDASVEAHFNLGINPSKGEQQVRAGVVLPHGTGKSKKVAAFVTPPTEKEAKEAGADLVGGKDLIEKIKTTGKIDFEIAVAEPEMMKDLAQIAKTLGPKGLMPSPKNETVTKNIKKTILELKGGKVNFKTDDTANIHVVIGKVSFGKNKLKENFQAMLASVVKARPQGIKGIYLKNVSISSSMGPGIKVELTKEK